MIKRMYFISSKCYYADGTGGFSYTHGVADYTSIFPRTRFVYDQCMKSHEDGYKEKGLDIKNMHVDSFSRV